MGKKYTLVRHEDYVTPLGRSCVNCGGVGVCWIKKTALGGYVLTFPYGGFTARNLITHHLENIACIP